MIPLTLVPQEIEDMGDDAIRDRIERYRRWLEFLNDQRDRERVEDVIRNLEDELAHRAPRTHAALRVYGVVFPNARQMDALGQWLCRMPRKAG